MKFYKKYRPLLELNNSKYFYIILTGGRGSMKTGHALRGILKASVEKCKRTCFFRETQSTIDNSVKAELEELIETEFKNRGFSYDKEKITHVNGSYMFFKGLKEVNRAAIENLKGIATNVDFFVVDEAQTVSKSVWEVLIPTIRKKGSVLIAIYNRIDVDLPVEKAFFVDYDDMSAPEGTYFVEVNYPEIEHLGLLSEQFLQRAEQLKLNKPEDYERDYLNKPHGMNIAKVVKYWSQDNINSDIRYCDDLDIYWSLDFNVNPSMSTLSHFDGEKFFVFDEIVINNCITQDVVEEFMNRYPPDLVKGVVQICGDASGKYRKTQSRYSDYAIIVNALVKAGYRCNLNLRRFNPPIQHRVNSFNSSVFSDSGERKVLVHPRCEKLIYNMKNLKYKRGTSIIDLPTSAQIEQDENKLYLGHIFDAVSYMVEYFKPVVRR